MSIATDYFNRQAIVLDGKYHASGMQDNNSGDTGSNREDILANWLTQHLPRAISPEIGGQIIDHSGHYSGQVDIVLYNNDVPRFGGNPKQYYFAEGVIAAIQIKSKLTSATLTHALKNLETVKVCKLRPASGLTIGTPTENILTGLFAFEIDPTEFTSIQTVIKALNKHESEGGKPVNFICINKKTYIAYNKGEWQTSNEKGEKALMSTGYVEVDNSEACIFRMVLTLSSESKKNIATSVDFQPYFLDGWD